MPSPSPQTSKLFQTIRVRRSGQAVFALGHRQRPRVAWEIPKCAVSASSLRGLCRRTETMRSLRVSGRSASRCAEPFLFQAWCPGLDRTDRLYTSNRNLARRRTERGRAPAPNLDRQKRICDSPALAEGQPAGRYSPARYSTSAARSSGDVASIRSDMPGLLPRARVRKSAMVLAR